MTPLFTKNEWNAAMPQLTKDMMAYLAQYSAPLFKDHGDHGEGWGSGSFVEIDGAKYVLTNQHVAAPIPKGQRLGLKLKDLEHLSGLAAHFAEEPWPWDLALLPVGQAVWNTMGHDSKAIEVEQLSLAHTPVPTEVFAFSGFAGERTKFVFNSIVFERTTSLAREGSLPADERWDARFHFGLDYRPDSAIPVVGDRGLPAPPGFSGSTVWNTCFVEAKANGLPWRPELAKVAGVLWGWSSGHSLLLATRVEHVRSFLLAAHLQLTSKGRGSSQSPSSG
jgi:hypothetical protein